MPLFAATIRFHTLKRTSLRLLTPAGMIAEVSAGTARYPVWSLEGDSQPCYGRDRGVGRGLGVGVSLGVTVGVGVAVAVGVGLGVGVGVGAAGTIAYA